MFTSIRRLTLGLVLTLGTAISITTLTTASPAHADYLGSPPGIAAVGSAQGVAVTGNNFTPGGTVGVFVYDRYWNLSSSRFITASSGGSCSRYSCTVGGNISTYLYVGACWQTDHVYAYDYQSNTWSNRSDTYIPCIG